jgi:hypothetical protein
LKIFYNLIFWLANARQISETLLQNFLLLNFSAVINISYLLIINIKNLRSRKSKFKFPYFRSKTKFSNTFVILGRITIINVILCLILLLFHQLNMILNCIFYAMFNLNSLHKHFLHLRSSYVFDCSSNLDVLSRPRDSRYLLDNNLFLKGFNEYDPLIIK